HLLGAGINAAQLAFVPILGTPLMNLLAIYLNGVGRADPETHFVTLHRDNGEPDIVANDDFLTDAPRKNQHGRPPVVTMGRPPDSHLAGREAEPGKFLTSVPGS